MRGTVSDRVIALAVLLTLLSGYFGMATACALESADATQEFVMLGKPYASMPLLANAESAPPLRVDYDALPVSKTIPIEGAFYRIQPTVNIAGYSYFFDVDGIDMEYEVESSIRLVKLVHELGVIEELKKKHKGKEFAGGVAEGVKGIGTGVVSLVTAPGQSIKGFGDKLRRTGRGLERSLSADGKVGEDARGHDRSLLGSGPAGAARRALAYQFGVDVYTSNPVLQKLLTDLSHAQMAGSVTTWVLPLVISAWGHFNPISGDPEVEIRIRDNPPQELRRLVGTELEDVVEMDREDTYQPLYKLLVNPNYSPRGIAYIGDALLGMRQVRMLPKVVGELSRASSPEEADMLTLSMRLFGLLNKNVQPLVGFAKYRALLAAFGANEVIYIMYPGDMLGQWEEVERSFNKILTDMGKRGMKGVEVWALGDVDPGLVGNLESRGVLVRQHILRDQKFFNPVVTAAQENFNM